MTDTQYVVVSNTTPINADVHHEFSGNITGVTLPVLNGPFDELVKARQSCSESNYVVAIPNTK